jgi:hypothetical protein
MLCHKSIWEAVEEWVLKLKSEDIKKLYFGISQRGRQHSARRASDDSGRGGGFLVQLHTSNFESVWKGFS